MVVRIAAIVLSLAGMLALITGLFFWIGTALNLISMHMLLGFLAVAALWVAGIGQAFAKSGSWILTACALLVGASTIYVGLYQASLMVGPYHWVVEVIHLVLGILTIGLGHMAAARHRKGAADSQRMR